MGLNVQQESRHILQPPAARYSSSCLPALRACLYSAVSRTRCNVCFACNFTSRLDSCCLFSAKVARQSLIVLDELCTPGSLCVCQPTLWVLARLLPPFCYYPDYLCLWNNCGLLEHEGTSWNDQLKLVCVESNCIPDIIRALSHMIKKISKCVYLIPEFGRQTGIIISEFLIGSNWTSYLVYR